MSSIDFPIPALEALLARSLGLGLLLIAFLTLLFSGEVQRIYGEADSTTNALETLCTLLLPLPLTPALSPPSTPRKRGKYQGRRLTCALDGVPTLGATLVYHFATGIVFYSYSYNTALSSAWLTLGSLTHLGLGAGAMMLLMFGKQAPRLSKRTGADKRTSGFPFGNKEADKRKKR